VNGNGQHADAADKKPARGHSSDEIETDLAVD
jgi:hypothetical protein